MTFIGSAIGSSVKVTIVVTIGIAGLLACAAMAQAGDSFGSSVSVNELSVVRGGEADNSNNTILTAASEQNTTATNQNNTIGGSSTAGAINVSPGALSNASGMTNVVMNTAPMANVQGIMTLNVVLH